MEAPIWVDAGEVQADMLPFAVGQVVTWPISTQLNKIALVEHVGADTAAGISWTVDHHAARPEESLRVTGAVSRVAVFRCRLARGHVVPGSVTASHVSEVDGWESEGQAAHVSGYLVTLQDARTSS